GGRRPALAGGPDRRRLPHGVRRQQVDRIFWREAESLLVASHRQLLVRGEQVVTGELLEVPVVVAVPGVEFRRCRAGAADDGPVAPEILIGVHDWRALRAEALDIKRGAA